MTTIISIIIAALLTDNFIFSRFYGCCPFLGVSDKPSTALGMGCAVTFVMSVSGAVTYGVYYGFLVPGPLNNNHDLTYLQTIAFILVIAVLVQFIEMFLRRYIPALYGALGIFLPLITTNCAVLGSALEHVKQGYDFGETVIYCAFAGLGFTLAITVFAGVREKMTLSAPPRAFRGFPITLIAAGLLAMAFSGFAGLDITKFF